ncbi:MAG: ABC transporter permease, partial [Thermomicrobiales bacterium]|nr:ABC transporter permease [Thermomicrobiales bacterium]
MADLTTAAERAFAAQLPERTYVTRGPWRSALHRLLANRMAIFGGVTVLVFVILAIGGKALAPQDPLYQDLFHMTEPPSSAHWFGTDELGRDLLSRIIVGARSAMIIATLVTLISAGLGAVIGLISAFAGGWVDSV